MALFGAPLSFGQPLIGPEKAPNVLRSADLMEDIKARWRLADRGDIDVTGQRKNGGLQRSFSSVEGARCCAQVGGACEAIYEALLPDCHESQFILTLGGDHSIPMGTLPAVMEARGRTKVVWVDAHADINTPRTSSSGNMHGQPVGLLMEDVYAPGVESLPGFEWLAGKPRLKAEDIIYIGLRDVDAGEKAVLRERGISAFSMFDVDKYGIGRVMDHILKELIGPEDNIHLSFDIDALDPFFAPSTGTTVYGGLTFREAHFICESLADTRRLTSMDMVEVNPSLMPHSRGAEETAEVARGLLGSALGSVIMWPVEDGIRSPLEKHNK